MSSVEEISYELIEFENQLNDWAERMEAEIDSDAHGARAERAMEKVRKCVETCRREFGEIHREFERG